MRQLSALLHSMDDRTPAAPQHEQDRNGMRELGQLNLQDVAKELQHRKTSDPARLWRQRSMAGR